MKSNPVKCHLLVSSCEKVKMEIDDFEIENSTCEKLLGVHFDNRLTSILYYSHAENPVKNLCTSKSQSILELIKK